KGARKPSKAATNRKDRGLERRDIVAQQLHANFVLAYADEGAPEVTAEYDPRQQVAAKQACNNNVIVRGTEDLRIGLAGDVQDRERRNAVEASEPRVAYAVSIARRRVHEAVQDQRHDECYHAKIDVADPAVEHHGADDRREDHRDQDGKQE